MKKENFVRLINAIKEHLEQQQIFLNTLAPFLGHNLECTHASVFINLVINVIEDEMDEKTPLCPEIFSNISWWLFDTPDCGRNKDGAYVIVDGKKIILETAGQLYDFLKQHNKKITKAENKRKSAGK